MTATMTTRTLLSISSTDHTRWLLEVFELDDSSSEPRRHAVWLLLRSGSWSWRCSCGEDSTPRLDLVDVLTMARMHFDAFSGAVRSSLDHPLAIWFRVPGGTDDVAVREAAESLPRPTS